MYKEIREKGLFGEYFRLEKLSKHGEALEHPSQVIDYHMLIPSLGKLENKKRKSNAGAKAYPIILIVKILILGNL